MLGSFRGLSKRPNPPGSSKEHLPKGPLRSSLDCEFPGVMTPCVPGVEPRTCFLLQTNLQDIPQQRPTPYAMLWKRPEQTLDATRKAIGMYPVCHRGRLQGEVSNPQSRPLPWSTRLRLRQPGTHRSAWWNQPPGEGTGQSTMCPCSRHSHFPVSRSALANQIGASLSLGGRGRAGGQTEAGSTFLSGQTVADELYKLACLC